MTAQFAYLCRKKHAEAKPIIGWLRPPTNYRVISKEPVKCYVPRGQAKLNLIDAGFLFKYCTQVSLFCSLYLAKFVFKKNASIKYQNKFKRKLSSRTNLKDLKWLCCSVLLIRMHCIYLMYLFIDFFNKDN